MASAKQLPNLTPEQQGFLQKLISSINPSDLNISENPLFQQLSGYFGDLFDQDSSAYQKFEAPYLRQFKEQIIPEISTRFAGAGAQSSSGFQQALTGASTDLSERLAALRGNIQLQSQGNALSTAGAPSQNALQAAGIALGTQPYQYMQKQQKGPNFLQSLFGGAAGAFSNAFGGGIGRSIFG